MRRTTAILTPVIAAALLAGCGGSSSGNSAKANGESAKSSVRTVRLVLPHTSIFTVGLPYAVAKEKGFFSKNGVKISPIFTKGGGANVVPVVSGAADVGMETGPSAIVAAAASGAPLRLVAATTTGSDILFFSKGGSPYKDEKSLSGQKVGISSPGSSTALAVEAVNEQLKADGLKPAVAQSLGSPPEQLAAVTTGQVAAGWTIPPTFFDKIDSGKLQLAFNGFKDLPAYADVVGRAAFTNVDFLKAQPEAVSGVLKAWQEAWDWAYANQDEAIKLWQAEAGVKGDPAILKKAFTYYQRPMFDGQVKGMDRVMKDYLAAGGKPVSPAQLAELVSGAPKAP